MLNYYDRFVPDLASNCAAFNNLLQKNKQCNWKSEYTKAVKSAVVKHLLTSADTLSHYDLSVPISLSCDGTVGISVVIFHRETHCLCLS